MTREEAIQFIENSDASDGIKDAQTAILNEMEIWHFEYFLRLLVNEDAIDGFEMFLD